MERVFSAHKRRGAGIYFMYQWYYSQRKKRIFGAQDLSNDKKFLCKVNQRAFYLACREEISKGGFFK